MRFLSIASRRRNALLEFAENVDDTVRSYLGYDSVADALLDPRGRLVRFTPRRRTRMLKMPGGGRMFCKLRRGRVADAEQEWRNLHVLREMGIGVPGGVFFGRCGRDTVIGIAAVPGRPLDALMSEGLEVERALAEMPEILRRLHGAGWAFRDMYWNHVFAEEGGEGLWLIDVERAFQPPSRLDRWIVKDLAGLASSMPVHAWESVSATEGMRFLRAALGPGLFDVPAIARRVLRKAERIRSHETRYPG